MASKFQLVRDNSDIIDLKPIRQPVIWPKVTRHWNEYWYLYLAVLQVALMCLPGTK